MKELREILKSSSGVLLKNFLVGYYQKFKSIENIDNLSSADDQAIELKAHKKAIELIKDMLSRIMDIESYEESVKKEEDKLYQL